MKKWCLLSMNTWSYHLKIIKHDTQPKEKLVPRHPYGENGVYRVWAVTGWEQYFCKILEKYAIEQLSKQKYPSITQLTHLEKLREGNHGNAKKCTSV
jgi:hypothetical protein